MSTLQREARTVLIMSVPNDPRGLAFYSVSKVAEILGIHRNTVLQRVRSTGAKRLLGARLDDGEGDWIFYKPYILLVAAQELAERKEKPGADDPGPLDG